VPRSRWDILVEELKLLISQIGEVYNGPDQRAHRPERLRTADDNPLLNAFLRWHDGPQGDDWTDRGAKLRNTLVTKTSWAVPSETALSRILECGPVVEVGAGTGYWAALLANRGGNIIAYDIAPPGGSAINRWHPEAHALPHVLSGGPDVLKAHPDRALFLCWPPQQSDMAEQCLAGYHGDTVIYVGEWKTSTSASKRFFRILDQEYERIDVIDLPAWPSMRDRLYVFRRPS